MDLQDIKQKLNDLTAGKLTPSEKDALRDALSLLTEEEKQELFPVEPYLEEEFHLPEEEVTNALSQLKKKTRKVIQWRTISRYAAILMLLLGSTVLLRKTTGLFNRKTTQYRSMKVENGKQGTLVLTDGTRITINGGSELIYPDKFTAATREVILLNGEAYFEIAQDAQHPFIVRSAQLKVKVLGTSFSVRDYADEIKASVAVNSGRIAVGPYTLTAGTGTILDKKAGTFTQQQTDTAATTAWLRGELIFNDATLQEVTQVLQHKYAVAFEVKDTALLKRRFTATFRNNSIQTIMQQLHMMSSIRYTITNDHILIQ